MEYIEDIIPDIPELPDIRSIMTTALGEWNIQMYYEAMGLDLDEGEENDHQ